MISLSAWYNGWRVRTADQLRTRFFSLHHAHLKIASGIGWTLLFVIIARLIGAGREMALAAHYGVGEVIDAYLFVFNLLSWPFTVWFNVLSIVLVPTVIRLRRDRDKAIALQRFRAGLLGLSIIIGVAFGLLFWSLLGSGLFLPYIGFPASTIDLTRSMVGWLVPIVPLGFIASFYSAWVMATGRYVNTLIEAVLPFVILLAIFFFPGGDVTPLLLGTLGGVVLQVLVLVLVLMRMEETSIPAFTGSGREWRQFWKNFGVMVTSNALFTVTVIVDQMMAAALDPGTIATLGYANRIIALILSLTALTVSRAILPIFSDLRAAADPGLSRTAMQWSSILFLGGVAAALVAWWCAPAMVALLFERGAFSTENTHAVIKVFSFALTQIPFYCGGLVLSTLLAASGRYLLIALVSAASLVIKVLMNWLLIPPLGVAGITLATGVMYLFAFFTMNVVLIFQPKRAYTTIYDL